MKKAIGFLQDPTGDFSVMRLIFFIGMMWLFCNITYLIVTKSPLSEISTFVGVTGGLLTGLKIGQTQIEKNKQPLDNTN